MNCILGISAYYHDSAACIIRDGVIVAAAQEERFNRIKHYSKFPAEAIRYCLKEGQAGFGDLTHIVFYEKPLLKFDRLIETYLSFAPSGIRSFLAAMPSWLKEKLFIHENLKKEFLKLEDGLVKSKLPPILFGEHHESHAAAAFFPSPYQKADVLCMDGVGEWATTSAWKGDGNRIDPLWEISFPHSLGLLFSTFTYYTGFKVNSGEYKMMGLAPYGKPVYAQKIYDYLIDLKEDGTFRLNMDYFNYCAGFTMTSEKFHALFDGPPRKAESPIGQKDMDLARSIQEVTEEVMLRLARGLQKETGGENLCLGGGVALNCVGNGRLLREGPYKNIWIQPAAGDAGGALGAALLAHHHFLNEPRSANGSDDSMRGGFLGPSFTDNEIESALNDKGANFEKLTADQLTDRAAEELAGGRVVGWFQGKMEFGPRALGARSIIGDARNPKLQSILNLKIKRRESFRPFAPSVLREKVSDYFELDADSPYMMIVAPVKQKRRIALKESEKDLRGIELLNVPKSDIPAVTHVDYSARIQTVDSKTNPRYYSLIKCFEKKTGCGVIVNTSFNVRGEPIVCTPTDAYRCFMRTEMDVLVIENYILYKTKQKPLREESGDRRKEREPNLRSFGLLVGGIFCLLGLLPLFRRHPPHSFFLVIGGLLVALAVVFPASLRRVRQIWMMLGDVLGWINSRLVLGTLFYAIFTPIGFFMRLFGKEPIAWKFEEKLRTYRTLKSARTADHMQNQY